MGSSNKCNFCFLCLWTLDLEPRGAREEEVKNREGEINNEHEQLNIVSDTRRRRRPSSVKFLVNYLLGGTRGDKRYERVVKDVLKLNGLEGDGGPGPASGSEPEPFLQLCGNCEDTSGRILELHLELEKVQMRIVQEVKTVREAILKGSGWLGGISGGGGNGRGRGRDDDGEAFEHFSRRFLEGTVLGSPRIKQKQVFGVLKDFQAAVSETSESSVHVPLVYLERSRLLEKPSRSSLLKNILSAPPVKIVKSEPFLDNLDAQDPASPPDSFFDVYYDGDDGNYDDQPNITTDLFPEVGITVKNEEGWTPTSQTKVTSRRSVKSGGAGPRSRRSKVEDEDEDWAEDRDDFEPKKRKLTPKRKVPSKPKPRRKMGRPRSTSTKPSPQKLPRIGRVLKRYSCRTCSFTCKTLCRFEQHLRVHEAEPKDFHCDQYRCGQSFSTRQLYILHQCRHKGGHKLKCDVCRSFVHAFELPAHLRTHEGVEESFPCPHCSNWSSSRDNQMRHVRAMHSFAQVDIFCEICKAGPFQAKKYYMDHLDKIHQAVERFPCEECDKTFLSQSALNSHKIHHTDQFVCETCAKRFSNRTNLEIHQRIHTKEEPVKCDHCEETFRGRVALQSHLIKEHGAEKLKCEICQKEYTSATGLQFHMVMTHDSGNAKFCPVCKKKCATAAKLKIHMDTHSQERNYICDECGKTFRSRENYRNHMRIHKEKKFLCPHCPKAFHMGKYLKQHLVSHSGEKAHICELCGKGFSLIGGLLSHRKICKGVVPVSKKKLREEAAKEKKKKPKVFCDKYICDVCGKEFRSHDGCRKHRLLHREKNFQCSYCPKAFSVGRYLKAHVRIHTGEKPYQCACGMAFTQDGSLSAHKKRCQVATQSSNLANVCTPDIDIKLESE